MQQLHKIRYSLSARPERVKVSIIIIVLVANLQRHFERDNVGQWLSVAKVAGGAHNVNSLNNCVPPVAGYDDLSQGHVARHCLTVRCHADGSSLRQIKKTNCLSCEVHVILYSCG
jgi:hypothetical protein